MKIAFVWTEFSSYMADCWRTLAACADVRLRVWVERHENGDVAFDPETLMRGVDYSWLYTERIGAKEKNRVAEEIAAFDPDVLFVCGWARPLPPFVARCEKLAKVPKVLCCDMPWEWTMRKIAARFVLWRHLRRFRKIFVPGHRAAIYGRWLGFRHEDIVQGEYGIDLSRFGESGPDQRVVLEDTRKRFVFVGRLSPEKGVVTLVDAYQRYRRKGGDWLLDVYGMGRERKRLNDVDGITVHGFVQPDEIPSIYAHAGAFVLASKWDPWPLVILESCASGLPIICTKNCWNRYELIRENGFVVPVGDAEAMATAMLHVGNLKGERGRELAANYSCKKWTERVVALVREVRDEK